MIKTYKYSGAGNDFIVVDGRKGVCEEELVPFRSAEGISAMCDRKDGYKAADGRIGADGVMVLTDSEAYDFRMEYYNSDGSSGMMCGNGGRCITAFADELGIVPANSGAYVFEAADGLHTGEILGRDGAVKTVRIKMIDAFGMREVLGGRFLNTGTRHFVLIVDDVEKVDVEGQGSRLRHDPEFAPEGANINFISLRENGTLNVRTFEKGVEAETLACGTGITASAIAAWYEGCAPTSKDGAHVSYRLHARRDDLSVDFIPADPAREVYLTGPAELIF